MNLDQMLTLPAHLLRRAHQLSTAIFAVELAQEDLTAIQYASLVAIADLEQPDTTKLSAMIGVDRATLGGVVDRLESKGLLSRKPSSRDRRTKLLSISEEGRDLLKRVEPAVRRVQQRLVEPLDTEESRLLCEILGKVLERGAQTTD